MTTTKRQHPSVRFQRGEVKDFGTAMNVYIEQYQEELQISREIYRDYPPQDENTLAQWRRENEEQSQAVAHIEKMVGEARTIYWGVMREANQRIVEQLREKHDSHLDAIADAIESGDWSSLAI